MKLIPLFENSQSNLIGKGGFKMQYQPLTREEKINEMVLVGMFTVLTVILFAVIVRISAMGLIMLHNVIK